MRRTLLLSLILLAGCTPAPVPDGTSSASSSDAPDPPNSYDAVTLLGLGEQTPHHFVRAEPGGVVVRYGKWSFNDLEAKGLVQYVDPSYRDEPWAGGIIPEGDWHLMSDFNTVFRRPGVLLASALLAHRARYGDIDFDTMEFHPLVQLAETAHCEGEQPENLYVGMYWGDDGDGGSVLFIDKDYCDMQGGGVWEAKVETSSASSEEKEQL